MQAERAQEALERDDGRWWALGSFAAHALLLLFVGLLAPFEAPVLPPPPPVEVEMVSAGEFAAATAAAAASEDRVPAEVFAPARPGPAEAALPPPDIMTSATDLLAGDILSDPANARVRRALPTLARDERITQLCNIEGLEQLRLALPGMVPDALVPYAFERMEVIGLTLDAPSGAFRSDGQWYGVRLNCTVAADFESVVAFAYRVGEPIPEALWESHGLLAADDDE